MAAEGMQSHDQSCENCPTESHPATKKDRINAPILPKPDRCAKSDRLLGAQLPSFRSARLAKAKISCSMSEMGGGLNSAQHSNLLAKMECGPSRLYARKASAALKISFVCMCEFDFRQAQDLWQRRHAPIARHGHPGQAYRTGLALAEWLRRTADRIDPACPCLSCRYTHRQRIHFDGQPLWDFWIPKSANVNG
jgi:hypothetical protein